MTLYQPRRPEIPSPANLREVGANPYDASGRPNLNSSGCNFIGNQKVSPSIKYSEKETRLLHALSYGDFLTQEPAVTYRTVALHCFSTGLTGPLAESVRRCYNAMVGGSPYRLTDEFDSLIEFPPEIIQNQV